MSFFETEETNQFTFEAFAAHPFYTAINRSLVQQALAPRVTRSPGATLTLVDMACGTGAITRLIAEELARQGRQARILAVDPSADALRHAQKSLEVLGAEADFFQGEAVDLPTLVHDVDAVFFCNAIHLIAINAQRFGRWPLFLLQAGCSPAIAPSTRVPTTKAPCALAVCGYAGPCSGYAKSIQKHGPHARQKQSPCSGSLPRNTAACSGRVALAVLRLSRNE